MHAHLCPSTAGLPAPAAAAQALLLALDGGPSRLLTVFHERADAEQQRERVGGSVYEVEALVGQPPSDLVAGVAGVHEFDGPRDAVQVAADRRSSYDRIAPAAQQVPGVLGSVHLRADDGALVVVALADTPATLQQAQRTILSTPLLPGEDPALLTGPSRSTLCGLQDHGLADLVTAAAVPAGAGR